MAYAVMLRLGPDDDETISCRLPSSTGSQLSVLVRVLAVCCMSQFEEQEVVKAVLFIEMLVEGVVKNAGQICRRALPSTHCTLV